MRTEEAFVINVEAGQDVIPGRVADIEVRAEEDCVMKGESGQDVCIPVRKQGIIRKLKSVLSAVFCTEEAANKEELNRKSKTLSIIAGIIMTANCSAITALPNSFGNRDEGVGQGVLIPATSSLMTTLLVIAVLMARPTFNLRIAKMLLVLAIISTACSYSAFVVMKLGSISQGSVIAIIFVAIYMLFTAIVFLSSKVTIKSPLPM